MLGLLDGLTGLLAAVQCERLGQAAPNEHHHTVGGGTEPNSLTSNIIRNTWSKHCLLSRPSGRDDAPSVKSNPTPWEVSQIKQDIGAIPVSLGAGQSINCIINEHTNATKRAHTYQMQCCKHKASIRITIRMHSAGAQESSARAWRARSHIVETRRTKDESRKSCHEGRRSQIPVPTMPWAGQRIDVSQNDNNNIHQQRKSVPQQTETWFIKRFEVTSSQETEHAAISPDINTANERNPNRTWSQLIFRLQTDRSQKYGTTTIQQFEILQSPRTRNASAHKIKQWRRRAHENVQPNLECIQVHTEGLGTSDNDARHNTWSLHDKHIVHVPRAARIKFRRKRAKTQTCCNN